MSLWHPLHVADTVISEAGLTLKAKQRQTKKEQQKKEWKAKQRNTVKIQFNNESRVESRFFPSFRCSLPLFAVAVMENKNYTKEIRIQHGLKSAHA